MAKLIGRGAISLHSLQKAHRHPYVELVYSTMSDNCTDRLAGVSIVATCSSLARLCAVQSAV
jgi:hypothetical protein